MNAASGKDDHPPSSSSASSSSSSAASSKKSSSSEYRDTIHQLEGKLSLTKGEQAKLEKDNQRLKNSITVCDTLTLSDYAVTHFCLFVIKYFRPPNSV